MHSFYSLSYLQSQWEQDLNWRRVYSICRFTSEPESSEDRVSTTISVLFTCGHSPIEFDFLLYTCMDGCVDPWFRITVLIRWLCVFLTHYHGCNKSSPHVANSWMCISNMMCLTTSNHCLILIFTAYCKFKYVHIHGDTLNPPPFLFSDILQPQWKGDLGQRSLCT